MDGLSKTVQRDFHKQFRHDLIIEVGIRCLLLLIFLLTNNAVPFKRRIQPEEVWLYKFPHSEDTFKVETVHFLNIVTTMFVVWFVYKMNRNWHKAVGCLFGASLSILLSIVIANFIKLVVGRPRPDFFERCFTEDGMPGDPQGLAQAECDGPIEDVIEGYKSFPSGHSALAFGCMAYLSFYLAWSLKVFEKPQPRLPSLRMIAFLTPVILASLIAASRTCDYHHHWQDVTVGSLIGILVSYLCYRQGFPSFLNQMNKGSERVPLSPPPRELIPLSNIKTF